MNQAPAGPMPAEGGQPESDEAALPGVDPAQLAAFEALIAANHDQMARVAFVVSEAPAPAQEAVRLAWTRAWRGLTSTTPPPAERQRDWLLGLAAAEARQLVESGYKPGDDAGGGSGVAATQASAAPAYKSDELELANTLAALDTHDRMIVGMRYVGGLDAEAIGRELSMPERAVLARLARVLKALFGEDRLAGMPSETVGDYEIALAERIRSLTGRALVGLDPAEVAKAAIDTAPEAGVDARLGELLNELIGRARAVDRRVWLAVAGVALFIVIVPRLLGFGAGPAAPTAIPTDATRLCQANELSAHIAGWAANGSDWIAAVELKNVSSFACLIDSSSEPWLVDRTRTPLIIGVDAASAVIRIGPGDVMKTHVQVHNYCGPAPAQPVTVGFRDGTLFVVADPFSGDTTSGIPTCVANGNGSITMQPWAP
ncbi:MAG TPA: sigma factor-like helix-turn-helix DNA-binding protein [Patescibacteria group bacterium]|nr:sigma factor-like helix-turn-helix DNA-binding protein [Patescibacteria group bacterium]